MVATDNKKRLFKGRVISDKMDKTVVVLFEQKYVHPKFQKVLKKTKKYKVHDSENKAKEGDVVEFYQVRPLSKEKYMCLHRVVTPAAIGI
ncbi:TPA: 30S ribosomal protein S17 [Candidatus Dependentiae bacterium]|nr:MAG: 30S ribosomal protein S17 [candidate division TM6 bacterium GW2011_GWF2_36_131]KKQ03077.1 MAG: 30S ribosomal protein S17 [candidate division TM6 bacterium GW2011_GWE2_36_25]KKQ18426.1 MAG: 30S ribosomal protein S17 [candidate division TM6 bacterium GW2011_GWA2_36_9]HBR71158.1 30S ribosomal protein S17 [Candidatus Dependentiae bacterium]HCU00465.1 30S ribosomal protein S17 [Candidatus Dependentiae bacterium]